MKNATLEDLVAIVRPPEKPVFIPTPDEWARAEQLLGAPFPNDYKYLIGKYGAGGIQTSCFDEDSNRFDECSESDYFHADWMFMTPCNDSFFEFFRGVEELKSFYRLFSNKNSILNGIGLFPEDGGLLPIAFNSSGFYLAWRCWRDRDWTIYYLDHQEIDNEDFSCDLTSYLIHELTLGGKFPDGIRFEDGEYQKSIFVPLEINSRNKKR